MATYPESLLRQGGCTAAPVILAISGASARTAALAPGIYEVVSDVNAHFLAGGPTVEAAVTSRPLRAWGEPVILFVPSGATIHVAGVVAAGGTTGNIYFSRRT